jgi:hypothetical protein
MEGCLRRERRAVERDTVLAWRIVNFRNAGAKLKKLQHYLDELKPGKEADAALEAAATFTTLASRGLVTIREVPKKGEANGG